MNLRTNFKVKVKLIKNGKILSVRIFRLRFSNSRKRILTEKANNYLEKIKFEKGMVCHIKVYYCSDEFVNEGEYNNHKELLHAFNSFTEQELLKEEWDKVLLPPSRVVRKRVDIEKLMKGLKRYREATLK